MRNIYILGSINTDLVISAERIPQKGETLKGKGFFIAKGGKGANQAVACVRSGGKVIMCGCVGDDLFGKEALHSLIAEGIDVKHIKVHNEKPTGTAVIIVEEGDNRIIIESGANAAVTKRQIDEFLRDATSSDIFLTQVENPINIVSYALQKANEKGMYVVLNPAPAAKEIIESLQYVNLLTPNETEAEILGGIKNIKSNLETLIVTLGKEGFRYIDESKDVTVPPLQVDVVDTTAAGDTFVGSMLARYACGDDLFAAAKYGSLAATLACTKKGAQPSIPKAEEVLAFRKKK